nr:3-phosphoglycerate dehydrogenase family protein [bacterium]
MAHMIRMLNDLPEVVYEQLPIEEFWLSRDAQSPEGILVRNANMHQIALPANLVAIGNVGTGVTHIPIERCSAKGVVVFNTPGAGANAIKEMVLMALLISGRKVIAGINWLQTMRDHGSAIPAIVDKGRKMYVGPEIMGKRLGVIGLGTVGQMVANAALNLGMKVVGYDPFLSNDQAGSLPRGVKRVQTMPEALQESDYITLHVALNDKTRGIIDQQALAATKPGAVLINFTGGELVDQKAALEALEQERLSLYITDFPNEALIGHQRIICLPHLGLETPETDEMCAMMAAKQLKAYIKTGSIKNSVNFPGCELSDNFICRIAVLHPNVSSLVAHIAAALSEQHIAISGLVTRVRGKLAYTVVDTDQKLDEHIVDRINAIPGVFRARCLMQGKVW